MNWQQDWMAQALEAAEQFRGRSFIGGHRGASHHRRASLLRRATGMIAAAVFLRRDEGEKQ